MRSIRIYDPGSVHHVIARFIDRRFCLSVAGARDQYLALLGRSMGKSDWRVLAYALMSNHVHLLMVAGDEEPEYWMRRVHSPFGLWLNKHVDGLGTVFADRPHVYIVADHRVAEILAYIHNNPVRAGVVRHARDSSWTSHRAYLGLESAPDWLQVEDGLRRIGSPSSSQLDAYVDGEVGASDPVDELVSLVDRIRPRAHRRGANLATAMYGDVPSVALVRRRDSRIRPDAPTVIATVCFAARVSPELVLERGQNEIRQLVLLVGRRFGLTFAEMSGAMGFSRQFAQRLMTDVSNIDLVAVERATELLRQGRWIRAVDKVASDPVDVPGRIATRKRRG